MFQIGEVWKIKLPERCHIESIWESRVGVQGLCDGYLILLFMVWSYLLSNVSFLFWNYQSDDFLHSAAWLCLSFSYFSVLNGAGKITHLYSFSHCFQCREAQNSSKPALLYTWCGQIQEFLKLLMLSLILLLLCLYYCIISLRELCVLKWVELLKWSGEVNLELACPFPIKQRPKSIWWRWEIKEEVEDGFVCVPSAGAAVEENSHSGYPALIISSGLLGACQHRAVHCGMLLGNCDF